MAKRRKKGDKTKISLTRSFYIHMLSRQPREVTGSDISARKQARAADGVAEVAARRRGNYFDSQGFGFLKHGQDYRPPTVRGAGKES